MTIKRRLFISNILMLVIPALVSVLMILISALLFVNIFYRQFMDETIHENNLSQMQRILITQSKEFIDSDEEVEESQLYRTVNKYLKTQKIKMDIYDEGALIWTLGSKSGNDIEEQLLRRFPSLAARAASLSAARAFTAKRSLSAAAITIYTSTRAER